MTTNCKFCNAPLTAGENTCPTCGKEQTILVLEDKAQLDFEAQRQAIRSEYRRNSILRYFSYFFLLIGLLVLYQLDDKIWIAVLSLFIGLILARLANQGISEAKQKQEAIDRILLRKQD